MRNKGLLTLRDSYWASCEGDGVGGGLQKEDCRVHVCKIKEGGAAREVA